MDCSHDEKTHYWKIHDNKGFKKMEKKQWKKF